MGAGDLRLAEAPAQRARLGDGLITRELLRDPRQVIERDGEEVAAELAGLADKERDQSRHRFVVAAREAEVKHRRDGDDLLLAGLLVAPAVARVAATVPEPGAGDDAADSNDDE